MVGARVKILALHKVNLVQQLVLAFGILRTNNNDTWSTKPEVAQSTTRYDPSNEGDNNCIVTLICLSK